MKRGFLGAALVAAAVAVLAAAPPQAPSDRGGAFVARAGAQLVFHGRPLRFGGANVEWLGVAGYGPFDPDGPHYPSHYEVDDALATARELGATVVRGQTLADSVGCESCIEPSLGRFNADAFAHVDYALASARRYGIKVIPTLVGDDARGAGGGCVYLGWRNVMVPGCSLSYMPPFWTNETVIGDVEAHIAAVLEHVNVYTHVAYRDDPTILGWDLVNGGNSPARWTRQIADFIRGIDSRHLILSGAANAGLRDVDACVSFLYPHWSLPLARVRPAIAKCRRARKPFIVYEYGWDRTNFPTLRALRSFLDTIRATPEIAGDAFWALQAHDDGHGWMPIPANTADPAVAIHGESGEWWALYYPGIKSLVSTAADMATRAQAIRSHDFAMRGLSPPPHAIPPAPTITSVLSGPLGVRVYWQGSAGATDYSVERRAADGGPWIAVCRRCVTDADDGYADADPAARGAWYRVVPYNLDGRAGRSSNAVQASG